MCIYMQMQSNRKDSGADNGDPREREGEQSHKERWLNGNP